MVGNLQIQLNQTLLMFSPSWNHYAGNSLRLYLCFDGFQQPSSNDGFKINIFAVIKICHNSEESYLDFL